MVIGAEAVGMGGLIQVNRFQNPGGSFRTARPKKDVLDAFT
jgi:hypothetical protein